MLWTAFIKHMFGSGTSKPGLRTALLSSQLFVIRKGSRCKLSVFVPMGSLTAGR